MAEVTATARTKEQGLRLKRLRETRGISKPMLANRLGFGSTQTLDLYERGVSIVRIDRVDTWAEAFDMKPQDFAEAIWGSGDPGADGWTFRGALHGIIPEWLIDELAEEWEGRPLINQRSAVEGIIQMAAKRRERVSQSRAQSSPRGVPQTRSINAAVSSPTFCCTQAHRSVGVGTFSAFSMRAMVSGGGTRRPRSMSLQYCGDTPLAAAAAFCASPDC